MSELSIKNFNTGVKITLVLGFTLIAISFYLGKVNLFLLLNGNLGLFADQFFEYTTYLGDGVIWVPIAVLFFIYRRKYLVLLFGAILFSTLFTQVTKNFIFPELPRPTKLIENTQLIHTVTGVELHTIDSFPSGHTTTAFTVFLLACLFIPTKKIIPFGLAIALLVGYSRVYLAQHFPLDVGAGMIAACLTMLLSIQMQKWRDANQTLFN